MGILQQEVCDIGDRRNEAHSTHTFRRLVPLANYFWSILWPVTSVSRFLGSCVTFPGSHILLLM